MTIQVDGQERLSLDEIAVLREIVQWRRTGGGEFVWASPAYRLADGKVFAWLWPRSQATCMKVGVTPDYLRVSFVWHKVASVAQAINLLVALGYLPERFSRAYRAGWEARAEATDADGALDLITWPEHVPAWGPAW